QNWFRTLSRARRAAEFAVAKYREFSDATKFTPAADTTKLSGLSEMLSVAGFTYIFFAENYCSGVPFSTANADGSLVYGSPLTTQQELDTAIARFDAAIAAANALTLPAATKAVFVNLASVGKARALLDEGQFAAAAAERAAGGPRGGAAGGARRPGGSAARARRERARDGRRRTWRHLSS